MERLRIMADWPGEDDEILIERHPGSYKRAVRLHRRRNNRHTCSHSYLDRVRQPDAWQGEQTRIPCSERYSNGRREHGEMRSINDATAHSTRPRTAARRDAVV